MKKQELIETSKKKKHFLQLGSDLIIELIYRWVFLLFVTYGIIGFSRKYYLLNFEAVNYTIAKVVDYKSGKPGSFQFTYCINDKNYNSEAFVPTEAKDQFEHILEGDSY